ncbi:kinase-like protein [Schizopora paradoxa]|uniref:Kinase-like protein n=1 Tax=Schizopora paradoxa TaxID=27342 RepID=A0A0H2R5J6_9AGAM|nr:kinase-like protein [Schizopora paradoxa]
MPFTEPLSHRLPSPLSSHTTLSGTMPPPPVESNEASKEVDKLADRLQKTTVGDNSTGESIKIVVQNEEGVETSPTDAPQRPSSAEVLARVLESREYLNLTGKIHVEPQAIRTKHGGAADVYVGTIISSGKKVAVKRLRLNIGGSEKIAKDIAREIRVWSELYHPNILPILGYCIEGDYPSLISTWMLNGSLREYMTGLDKNRTIAMMSGIANGLSYIHSKGAIHSDLKSDNVLVSPDEEALLTDFGVSRMDALSAGFTTHSVKGSTRWQAVEFFEIFDDESPAPTHTKKTDVWAFGMTVYELLTHDVPYHNLKDNNQVVNYISRGKLPKQPAFASEVADRKIDEFMWSICEKCWSEVRSRPSMEDLQTDLLSFSSKL